MSKQLITYIAAALALLLLAAGCGRADGGTGAAPAPSDPLAGSRWALQSYGPAGQPKPAAGQPTAEFAAGKISGNAGCNSFSGSYAVSGADLKVGELMQTAMACADPALMQQESDYVNALLVARSFALAGDTLTIGYDGGELRFVRQAPVVNRPLEGRWQLSTLATGEVASSLLAGTSITAALAGGQISGQAGCNSYFGSYAASGVTITISGLGATKMACSAEIMAQEQSFLAALAAATSYSIAGDQLTLTHPGGQLQFTAAP